MINRFISGCSIGLSSIEITNIETHINTPLPNEFKEFMLRYGGKGPVSFKARVFKLYEPNVELIEIFNQISGLITLKLPFPNPNLVNLEIQDTNLFHQKIDLKLFETLRIGWSHNDELDLLIGLKGQYKDRVYARHINYDMADLGEDIVRVIPIANSLEQFFLFCNYEIQIPDYDDEQLHWYVNGFCRLKTRENLISNYQIQKLEEKLKIKLPYELIGFLKIVSPIIEDDKMFKFKDTNEVIHVLTKEFTYDDYVSLANDVNVVELIETNHLPIGIDNKNCYFTIGIDNDNFYQIFCYDFENRNIIASWRSYANFIEAMKQ
jgi:hypothetical protein